MRWLFENAVQAVQHQRSPTGHFTNEQFIVNDLAIADNEVKEISGILLGTYQSLYVESTGAVTFTLVGLEEQAEIPS